VAGAGRRVEQHRGVVLLPDRPQSRLRRSGRGRHCAGGGARLVQDRAGRDGDRYAGDGYLCDAVVQRGDDGGADDSVGCWR
jgi:hypothetical protein